MLGESQLVLHLTLISLQLLVIDVVLRLGACSVLSCSYIQDHYDSLPSEADEQRGHSVLLC